MSKPYFPNLEDVFPEGQEECYRCGRPLEHGDDNGRCVTCNEELQDDPDYID